MVSGMSYIKPWASLLDTAHARPPDSCSMTARTSFASTCRLRATESTIWARAAGATGSQSSTSLHGKRPGGRPVLGRGFHLFANDLPLDRYRGELLADRFPRSLGERGDRDGQKTQKLHIRSIGREY